MARRKQEESQPPGSPAWMTTYGDMVTLLLCFFVILFAMSEIDIIKFQAVIMSFQGSPGVLEGGQILEDGDVNEEYMDEYYEDLHRVSTEEMEAPDFEEEEDDEFSDLQDRVEAYIEREGLGSSILVSRDHQGLMLRFQDDVLFEIAKADLKEEAKGALAFIAGILKEPDLRDKFIRVEGHTDNVQFPPGAEPFETNWELSVARAVSAGRFLIEEENIEPTRISMSGYGEYHPIATNQTVEGRAQNRRVDIVILRGSLEN